MTFNLPEMQGRIPLGMGRGPGLDLRRIGQMGGQNSVALTTATIPAHSHSLTVSKKAADKLTPDGNMPAAADNVRFYSPKPQGKIGAMANGAMTESGGDGENSAAPHENRMPSQGVYFVIALQGEYPQRS